MLSPLFLQLASFSSFPGVWGSVIASLLQSEFDADYDDGKKIKYLPVHHSSIYRPLGYERVYLPLHKMADTLFHIQGDDM